MADTTVADFGGLLSRTDYNTAVNEAFNPENYFNVRATTKARTSVFNLSPKITISNNAVACGKYVIGDCKTPSTLTVTADHAWSVNDPIAECYDFHEVMDVDYKKELLADAALAEGEKKAVNAFNDLLKMNAGHNAVVISSAREGVRQIASMVATLKHEGYRNRDMVILLADSFYTSLTLAVDFGTEVQGKEAQDIDVAGYFMRKFGVEVKRIDDDILNNGNTDYDGERVVMVGYIKPITVYVEWCQKPVELVDVVDSEYDNVFLRGSGWTGLGCADTGAICVAKAYGEIQDGVEPHNDSTHDGPKTTKPSDKK